MPFAFVNVCLVLADELVLAWAHPHEVVVGDGVVSWCV